MASRTTNSGEAMAEQPAAQVALKLGANKGGQLAAGIALLRFDEEGGQISRTMPWSRDFSGSRRW